MSSTASLSVDTFDLNDTEGVTRDDTALVQTEAMLTLSLSLVHEALVDRMALVNNTIGNVLDLLFLLTG